MRKTAVIISLTLVGGLLGTQSPGARKVDKRPVQQAAPVTVEPFAGYDPAITVSSGATLICDPTSFAGTSYFCYGYGTDPWTFDHGDPDPFEGWTSDDLTTNNFTGFRRVNAPIWAAGGNMVNPPIIEGGASVWLGFFENEMDSACWSGDKIGYGNDWHQRFISPTFTGAAGVVTLEFDYFYDTENAFDFVRVIIDDFTTLDTVATFTGKSGSYSVPLSFAQNIVMNTSFRVIFEFDSDSSFSTEDGFYTPDIGAFGIDMIDVIGITGVTGGESPPYNFETNLMGWVAEPTPGVGSFASVKNLAAYPPMPPGCQLDANVVSFHNDSDSHDALQHERFFSPVLDLTPHGSGLLNIVAEYDVFADMPPADNIGFGWGFTYYPWVCPASGDTTWSPPAGFPPTIDSQVPVCTRLRAFANDLTGGTVSSAGAILVPAGSVSCKFYIEILSTSLVASGNISPLFDNIRVCVSDESTVLHVPSPTYPDIVTAVIAADPFDTVLVAPGTYTGGGNRDVDTDGDDLVFMSEGGSAVTVLDLEFLGRAFNFHSGEGVNTVVEGFTIINGNSQLAGSALRIGNVSASPTIRGCRFTQNGSSVVGPGGVISIVGGSPTFECSVVDFNTSASDGVVNIEGGSPKFDRCRVDENISSVGAMAVYFSASASMDNCTISNNVALAGLISAGATGAAHCTIEGNAGIGAYFLGTTASRVDTSLISSNGSTGIVLEGSSPSFTGNDFILNEGGGIVIASVVTAAASRVPARSPGLSAVSAVSAATSTAAPSFIDCVISGNTNTSSSGGGILLDCTNVPVTAFIPQFINCIITGNSSGLDGGGVAVCGNATFTDIAPYFENCTVAANIAGNNGGGMYVGVSPGGEHVGVVTASKTILWGNCAMNTGNQAFAEDINFVQFDCADVDTVGLAGNGEVIYMTEATFGDPYFCEQPVCDPDGTISGDFTVSLSSPANPSFSPCSQLIGAQPPVCPPPSAVDDIPHGPEQTALLNNVPNPFNPSTTIRFDLASTGHVTFRIYDVAGRVVRTLMDEPLPLGFHSLLWDGSSDSGQHVATGVYFGQLIAGGEKFMLKMVVVK